MSIGAICNREVVVAQKDTGILEAAQLMREFHVGDLVVVEDRNLKRTPIGILTDRDLVIEVLAAGLPQDTLTAGDVMSVQIVTGREGDGIWTSLQQMRSKGIRRLPVVDQHGYLVGILTMDDLLELLAAELFDLAKLVNREQDKEKASRR
jgi:CBS domain-containing protein